MAEIPLFRGAVALVDDSDAELVLTRRWRAQLGKCGTSYAVSGAGLLMHRFILGEPDGFIDHQSRDGLDNRRANLRLRTNAQNMANQTKREGLSSRFKGVTNSDGRWRAQIKHEGEPMHLGMFDTEERAAQQYDRAARLLFGRFARTNAEMGLI